MQHFSQKDFSVFFTTKQIFHVDTGKRQNKTKTTEQVKRKPKNGRDWDFVFYMTSQTIWQPFNQEMKRTNEKRSPAVVTESLPVHEALSLWAVCGGAAFASSQSTSLYREKTR